MSNVRHLNECPLKKLHSQRNKESLFSNKLYFKAKKEKRKREPENAETRKKTF
jgi:hypothetical protein